MERGFYVEDSPWVEMRDLQWGKLTNGCPVKRVGKGYVFYNQQEFCDDIYIIKSGRVAMCLCTPEGGMRQVVILDQGCIFGQQTLLDNKPNSCLAETVSNVAEVYVMPKSYVRDRVRNDYELVHNFLAQSNRINRLLLTQVELMSFRPSESRVCFYLLHMADQYSIDLDNQRCIQIQFTHQDIADVTGLSRVCVSNIISRLMKENILDKKSGAYYVVQMDRLREKIEDYRSGEPGGAEK